MKSQGILRLAGHLVLERDSVVVKVISFKKVLLALLPKDLPWVVSENWSFVREMSGNLFHPNGWQPW